MEIAMPGGSPEVVLYEEKLFEGRGRIWARVWTVDRIWKVYAKIS